MKNPKEVNDFIHFASEPAVAYLAAFQMTPGDTGLSVVHYARAGIKTGYLLYLGDILSLSLSDLSRLLHVSLRTLQRYGPDFILDADASSKVIQLNMLQTKGLEVFGHQQKFNQWLRHALPELEGMAPLDVLDTPFGYQIVHQILGRIEHGIFA